VIEGQYHGYRLRLMKTIMTGYMILMGEVDMTLTGLILFYFIFEMNTIF